MKAVHYGMRGQNPNSRAALRPPARLAPGIKSATHRTRATPGLLDWWADFTPEQRGRFILYLRQQWEREQEQARQQKAQPGLWGQR